MRFRTLSLAAGVFLAATVASAADWPRWRGPDGTGVSKETGLLKSWPAAGPSRAWAAKGLGGGFSSVVVAGGTIYGTGVKNGKQTAWALKESDGSPKWSVTFSENRAGDPNSTPTVHGGKMYALSVAGDLTCLDAANGKIVWQKSYAKDLGGRMMSGWGYSESVLIDGEKLICTPGGDKAAVVALNKDTGAVIWKSEVSNAGGAGYASPVRADVGGVPMYITLLGKSGGVVAVHADTGKLLWQYTRIVNGTANIPTVIVKGDKVWCSTGYGDGGSALLQVVPESSERVAVKELKYYRSGELQNHHGGMVMVGDHVYFGSGHNDGRPACVEFATGAITWGPERNPAGGSGSAAVVAADGMLYFRYQSGLMALLKATPEGMSLVSSFKIPEPSGRESWQHPVIANGKLYLRDQDKLHCFNIKAK